MDENKDKINNNEAELSDEELRLKKEMEELARTFQEELDKAKAQEEELAREKQEELDILIQEIEDEDEDEEEDISEIPEEELCECCGEKRRGTKQNPDSPYCQSCERGLRHYPFDFLNILLVLIFIALSLFACSNFAGRIRTYGKVGEADKYAKELKRESAVTAYNSAVQSLEDSSINAELVYSRQLQNLFAIGNIEEVPNFNTQFTEKELKLPHFKKVREIFKAYDGMSAARTIGYGYIYEYEDIENIEDLPYDELMKKLDAMVGAPIDTAAIKEKTDEGLQVGGTPYGIKAETYDISMILFLKTYVSAMCNKDLDTQREFLEQIYKEKPEYTWIYAAMLGEIYLKQGKDITEICDRLRAVDAEDSVADLLTVIQFRIKGNYDESIKLAQKWIDKNDKYSYEFYRQQALCYLLKKDYNKAYSLANSANELNYTKQSYDTLALCCIATGNTSAFDEIAKLYDNYQIDFSENVLAYKDGKITIEDILTKGEFDV